MEALKVSTNNKLEKKIRTRDAIIPQEKYDIALKFINKILTNLAKDQIDELTKFRNIDREDIIKEVNKTTLDEMSKDLFQYFDKSKCRFYRKTPNLVTNVLRGMCKELNMIFQIQKKDKCVRIDGKTYKKCCYFYTINKSI